MLLISAFTRYLNTVHDVDMPPNQYWYCTLVNSIVLTATMCSTCFIMTMTFERFYSIIRPHKAASFNTVKKARIIIVCIIILSISFNIPHLFLSDHDGRFCVANRISSVNVYGAFYYWSSFAVNFALPFVSLLAMNSVIIHTLRQRSKLDLTRSEGQGQSEGQSSKTKSSEKQIYIMLLLVTFGFLILTTPLYILILYQNSYHGTTPHFHAGFYLFYNVGEKTYYH